VPVAGNEQHISGRDPFAKARCEVDEAEAAVVCDRLELAARGVGVGRAELAAHVLGHRNVGDDELGPRAARALGHREQEGARDLAAGWR